MSKWDLFLQFLKEGRHWLEIIIPALFAWHIRQPKWMRKECDCEKKDGA